MDAAIFGIIVADIIGQPIDIAHPPRQGSLTKLNSIQLTTGGNVCNVSLALARLGLSCAAAGLIGNDLLGRAVMEQLKLAQVHTDAVFVDEHAPTSATIVAVEAGGERTFFHSPGAVARINAETFRKSFEVFRECAWVQLGYFGLLPAAFAKQLPALLPELRQTAPGTRIALDTLDPPGDWKSIESILPHLDLFAPSRSEAIALSGEKSPSKTLDFFRETMPRGIIGLKMDRDGCWLDDGTERVEVPAYVANVVDTTGAGDAWFAGVITGLRNNLPLKQIARLGNRVAADCCEAIGASAGIKNLKETLSRL